MPPADFTLAGWDIGGAHLKACVMRDGAVLDVAQWACPLWLGMDRLDEALGAALARWPGLVRARHAVTMTGEMVDLFKDREDGVARIVQALSRALPAHALHFFAGDAGWRGANDAPASWPHIASANWLATARHAARCFEHGWLVDIGSTTTDLIAFAHGHVPTASRSDLERLASGELAYQGMVRTPLCALGPRIEFRGHAPNVMNEFFATTADVYRLTGELDPAHDLQPSADQAPKDMASTRRRLARMIGLDAQDASEAEWLAFARAWRRRQVQELGGQLARVMRAGRSPGIGRRQATPATGDQGEPHGTAHATAHDAVHDAVVVAAGCGDVLVRDVVSEALAGMPAAERPRLRGIVRYANALRLVAPATGERGQASHHAALRTRVQVCAPCVAVASLFAQEVTAMPAVDGAALASASESPPCGS